MAFRTHATPRYWTATIAIRERLAKLDLKEPWAPELGDAEGRSIERNNQTPGARVYGTRNCADMARTGRDLNFGHRTDRDSTSLSCDLTQGTKPGGSGTARATLSTSELTGIALGTQPARERLQGPAGPILPNFGPAANHQVAFTGCLRAASHGRLDTYQTLESTLHHSF